MLRNNQQSTWQVVAVVIAVFLLLWVVAPWFSGSPPKDQYAVMIDAGSTGSRVHVYHFVEQPGTGNLVLKSEIFQQLQPGLSSYAEHPAAGANSLLPLLEIATSNVPEALQPTTPLQLKATAGLRLLLPEQAEALLSATRSLLSKYRFAFEPSSGVEIMGGLDEGLFGWVTVNYLLDTIGQTPARTAAVLDLGGGSTQIAMSVPSSHQSGVDATQLAQTPLFGRNHAMYLFSHLGYGLMAGRAAVLAAANGGAGSDGAVAHPCVAHGTTVKFTYGSSTYVAEGTTASSDDSCEALVTNTIKGPKSSLSKNKGPSPADQQVFAMSYYFDRATNVGLIPPGALEGHLEPAQFRHAARAVCRLSPDQILEAYPTVKEVDSPFLCLDLCFISSLMQDGFGLHADTPVTIAKKIAYNGEMVETAWSLGAALQAVSSRSRQ